MSGLPDPTRAFVVAQLAPAASNALNAATAAVGDRVTLQALATRILERAAATPNLLAACAAELDFERNARATAAPRATPPLERKAPAPIRYPWDDWKATADIAGMRESTAWAGRALMRECYQHDWKTYMGESIEEICGYRDGGSSMFAFGMKFPEMAEQAWRAMEAEDAGNGPEI